VLHLYPDLGQGVTLREKGKPFRGVRFNMWRMTHLRWRDLYEEMKYTLVLCCNCRRIYEWHEKYGLQRDEDDWPEPKNTLGRKREYIRLLKKKRGCMLCGHRDVRALDLLHPSFRGSEFPYLSWQDLKEELPNATVLCCNCRLITQWEEKHPRAQRRFTRDSWQVGDLLKADLTEREKPREPANGASGADLEARDSEA